MNKGACFASVAWTRRTAQALHGHVPRSEGRDIAFEGYFRRLDRLVDPHLVVFFLHHPEVHPRDGLVDSQCKTAQFTLILRHLFDSMGNNTPFVRDESIKMKYLVHTFPRLWKFGNFC